ncbi:MAG: hypothetical protein ACPGWR_18615 [Ardenticatenaceae bacterium]
MSSINELEFDVSHASGEAGERRLSAERVLHFLLDDLVHSQEGEQIRILSDQGVIGGADGDVVIQIDEYDFRLRLLDAPDSQPRLGFEELTAFQEMLEANPSTVAVLLTWTSEQLLTIPLTIARIRFLLQKPRLLPRLLSRARPLLGVLQNLIARQIKQWERGLDLTQRAADEPIDIWQVFALSLEEAFEKERNRSYRQHARKMAAHHFPVESEKHTILAVLDEALQGKSAHELIKQLTA